MKRYFLLTLSAAALLIGMPAMAVNYPSGEITCGTVGSTPACYTIYRPPGGTASRKYLSNPYVLSYLTNTAQSKTLFQSLGYPPLSATGRPSDFTTVTAYPAYNWNAGMPVGSLVGDKRNGKLYVMEPIAGDGDSGSPDGNFSYSNVFPQYIQSASTGTLKTFLAGAHVNWLSAVDNVLTTTTDGNSFPSGTIVHQSSSNDYYRLTGYVATDGRKSQLKQYIGTTELLHLWLRFTNAEVTADVSAINAAPTDVQLPPGLLVRTVADPTLYFTDDNGFKQQILNGADLSAVGLKISDVHYLQQSSLDSTPSQILVP